MTAKPFGVNLTFLPTLAAPDFPGYVQAIIDGGVKVVETAGNNPQQWLPMLHEAGIKVIHKDPGHNNLVNTEGDPERLLARQGLRAESSSDKFGRPLRTTHSTPR